MTKDEQTLRGARACMTGIAAEEAVWRRYRDRGATLRARRWRAKGGEIDLIVGEDGTLVFVEVKAARTHDAALTRLRAPQMQRLCLVAQLYLDQSPEDPLIPVRFDLATVDRHGTVEVLENAFGDF